METTTLRTVISRRSPQEKLAHGFRFKRLGESVEILVKDELDDTRTREEVGTEQISAAAT